MTMLSTAGRYKRLPSPPMPKEAGSKNGGKALGPHYDYQRLRKCNSQQALENPDWRTRTSDNASSPTPDGEQAWRNLISSGKQWIGMDAFSTTPTAGEGKHEEHLHKASGLPQDRAMAGRDVRYRQQNVFALSSELEPKILKTLGEEQPVPYGILKHVCLSSSKEHPLSLLEVAPLGSVPSFLFPSVVDIRPLKGNLMQRKPDNSQEEQLTAALKAAEATPHKVRVHMNQKSRQKDVKVKHSALDEPRVRKGTFDLPEIIAAQIHRIQDCSSESRLSFNQTARLVNDEEQIPEKDEAFKKFLMKLGQKNRDLPDERSRGRDRVDSGYEDGSRGEQSGGSTETCILRYRTQRTDERKQASPGPSACRLAREPEISHKENTSRSGEEPVRFRNLNPKAREFLSFVSNRSSNSEDGGMEPLQAIAMQTFASNGGQVNAMPFSGLGQPNVSSLQQHAPPYGLLPFAAQDVTADPLTINSFMGGRLVPVQMGADQFGGQFPAPALPFTPMPPMPSIVPPALRPQAVLQSVSITRNNMMGIPPAPAMMNTAFPLQNSSNNCLNMASCQMPLMTGASCLPQPVPKPRRPDPGDQQAYEAWIEWRKANEPGYALECRLRQQRRAQRSMTDKATSRAPPPAKKGEGSGSK